MSIKTVCDVSGCNAYAASRKITVAEIEIGPTGDSVYSAYEERKATLTTVDLCAAHYNKYVNSLQLVKSGLSLTFVKEEL